jgi:hypothetical protein
LTYGAGVWNTHVATSPHQGIEAANLGNLPEQKGSTGSSSSDDAECTVTLNFPDMLLVENTVSYSSSLPSYASTLLDQRQCTEENRQDVEEPQAFEVRVQRCHHDGIESGTGSDQSQLPAGFSDAVQRMDCSPRTVSEESLV